MPYKAIVCSRSRVRSNFPFFFSDLKPANILLKKLKDTYEVKIADFGFARQGMEMAISVVGTPAYQAPEIFGKSNSQDVNKKADVYGYGVVSYFLFCNGISLLGKFT